MRRVGEEVLSFRRAAVRLGWEDNEASERRLRKMVRGREKQLRRTLTANRGESGRVSGVTMAVLRKHLPWLFRAGAAERSELEQRFLEHLRNIDERVEGVASAVISKTVDPQIDELHGRCTANERRADAIEREIAAVSLKMSRLAAVNTNNLEQPRTASE